MKKPDFFLTTFELKERFEPRACYVYGQIRGSVREDGLIIGIKPVLVGQHYGLGEKDVNRLIIFSRFSDDTLLPKVSKWPMHVYVFRPINENILVSGKFEDTDVQMIFWGELYLSIDDVPGIQKTFRKTNPY